MNKKINDLWQRAVKTFVQAFFGVFIPEVCAILANIENFDWNKWYVYIIPLVCGALSAGISAAWNGIINATDKEV